MRTRLRETLQNTFGKYQAHYVTSLPQSTHQLVCQRYRLLLLSGVSNRFAIFLFFAADEVYIPGRDGLRFQLSNIRCLADSLD